ncbi:riboflavin kinase, partial [Rhizobium johnstonii]|uniref:riboflavin kinase n=1 Tax=Rhizobium johnstonii TaxID=3019933 RepID=UPI003F98262E
LPADISSSRRFIGCFAGKRKRRIRGFQSASTAGIAGGRSDSRTQGDLYGQLCSVSFFGYLRPELKFDGLDQLVAQIKRDEEEARALLA